MLHLPINFIDVTLEGKIDSRGIASRDPGETYEDFFKNVFANEKVIGFEWDGLELKAIIG